MDATNRLALALATILAVTLGAVGHLSAQAAVAREHARWEATRASRPVVPLVPAPRWAPSELACR